MIVPSIDIQDGQAVQLVEGREKVIDAGDPRPLAERFARVGEVAVIDLDAALGRGSNADLIRELCQIAPCRVGGGIRDVETARSWLDAGARRVILGTAATVDVLSRLPRERVIAALDARGGRVVVEGWTKLTDVTVEACIDELRDQVSGFLLTFVEHEGRMGGFDLERVATLVKRAGRARVTVAGGVRDVRDINGADQAGADAQVGMALYTGTIGLAQGFAAPLRSDRPDGLWPTVVCDTRGSALGLCYSNLESLTEAIETGHSVYYSRSRQRLWRKGETSGATQRLVRVDVDCDRDTLRFVVEQAGTGFCHTGSATCFGGFSGLEALECVIRDRVHAAPAGSYTDRLLTEPGLLEAKLVEEAGELGRAAACQEVVHESADLMYFALVAMARRGARLAEIDRELDRRSLLVTRRPGNAKIPTADGESA